MWTNVTATNLKSCSCSHDHRADTCRSVPGVLPRGARDPPSVPPPRIVSEPAPEGRPTCPACWPPPPPFPSSACPSPWPCSTGSTPCCRSSRCPGACRWPPMTRRPSPMSTCRDRSTAPIPRTVWPMSCPPTPRSRPHLYAKSARPGRKLGHITAMGDDPMTVRARGRPVEMLTG